MSKRKDRFVVGWKGAGWGYGYQGASNKLQEFSCLTKKEAEKEAPKERDSFIIYELVEVKK